MMSLETIHSLSRQAAARSAREKKVPFTIEQTDIDDAKRGNLERIKITNMGTRCPKGWRRVSLQKWFDGRAPHGVYFGDSNGAGAFFVDKEGWGAPGEPALTIREFFDLVRPGYGYAMVEEGQFQVKVGVFEKIVPKKRPSETREADRIDGFDRDDLGESPDY